METKVGKLPRITLYEQLPWIQLLLLLLISSYIIYIVVACVASRRLACE